MLSQKGGARTDTVVKLVLIFFVSLLSFSVGTFVGKQVSDSDYKRLALEDEYKSNGHEVADGEAHGEAAAVSEEEVAHLTDEFVKNESAEPKMEEHAGAEREVASESHDKADDHGYKKVGGKKEEAKDMHAAANKELSGHEAPAPAAAAHKEAPAHKMPAPANKMDEAADAAHRVAGGKSATKTEVAPRQPNSVLPSVATSAVGKFTIQVASFASEEEAKTNAAELKEKGWNAFYVPADIKGKTWYRVSVGLFSDMKSASTFRQKFLSETNISSAIVQKIVQ